MKKQVFIWWWCYSLIGNHEIMNLLGNFNYSSQKDIDLQGGLEIEKNSLRQEVICLIDFLV